MNPKLSFIVPVYNVSPYLRKCVDSLIHQDFRDYEIILVDDGSTDGSGELCDEIVRELKIEDRRLKNIQLHVIHQENGGLSAARNAGLNEAKGEYVCFVDSDDFWEENVLGRLMEQVERENLDVLRFNYQNVRLVENKAARIELRYEVFNPYKRDSRSDNNYSSKPTDGVTYLNTRINTQCYAVMYIIRRSRVPYFIESIHFEDTEWLPRMMLVANRVASSSTIVYNYLVRPGSITQVQGDTSRIRKNVNDSLKVIAQYNQYIEQYPNCKWLCMMRSSMVVSVLANIAKHLYSEREGYIKRLKELEVYPLTMKTELGKTYLRKAMLINVSPRFAIEVLHLKK